VLSSAQKIRSTIEAIRGEKIRSAARRTPLTFFGAAAHTPLNVVSMSGWAKRGRSDEGVLTESTTRFYSPLGFSTSKRHLNAAVRSPRVKSGATLETVDQCGSLPFFTRLALQATQSI